LSPEAAGRDVLRPFHVAPFYAPAFLCSGPSSAALSSGWPKSRIALLKAVGSHFPSDTVVTRRSREERIGIESVALANKGEPMMWTRWICAAAICLAFVPQADASGIFHRASCAVVRFYRRQVLGACRRSMARSKGATDAEIETARIVSEIPGTDARSWVQRRTDPLT